MRVIWRLAVLLCCLCVWVACRSSAHQPPIPQEAPKTLEAPKAPSKPVCGDDKCEPSERRSCPKDCAEIMEMEEAGEFEPYYFVKLEDLSGDHQSKEFGVFFDAITLTKSTGHVSHASFVGDFNIAGRNDKFLNPEKLYGPPDDQCRRSPESSFAMGGQGGFVVMSFATQDFDGRVEPGDTLFVHQVGKSECPDQGFADKPYRVWLMSSPRPSNRDVLLGEATSGQKFVVPLR